MPTPFPQVRRVDDLGRVTIPKEIRRTIKIEPDDPVEFYVDIEKQEIIIKKCKQSK